jgi:hypothetical protein
VSEVSKNLIAAKNFLDFKVMCIHPASRHHQDAFKRLSIDRRDQDRGFRQECFELVKCLLSLGGPREASGLSQKPIERRDLVL